MNGEPLWNEKVAN
jgi:hypothetical protein